MVEYIAPLGTVVIICTTHLTLKRFAFYSRSVFLFFIWFAKFKYLLFRYLMFVMEMLFVDSEVRSGFFKH